MQAARQARAQAEATLALFDQLVDVLIDQISAVIGRIKRDLPFCIGPSDLRQKAAIGTAAKDLRLLFRHRARALMSSDVRAFRIPDPAGLGLLTLGPALSPWSLATNPSNAFLGALIGYVTFAAIGEIYLRWSGRERLGLGDAKCWRLRGRDLAGPASRSLWRSPLSQRFALR